MAAVPWRAVARRAVLTLLVLVVVDVLWIGIRARRAEDHLHRAQDALATAAQLVAQGRLPATLASSVDVTADTGAAVRLTDDPLWHLTAHLPLIGSSLVSAHAIAAATDSVAREALLPLGGALATLQAERLGRGGLDLTRLSAAATVLLRAQAVVGTAHADIAVLPLNPLLGTVGLRRQQLLLLLDQLSTELGGPARAGALAPSMLGIDGPRRYLLALQNPAEARGSGGVIGAFGIVVADRGRLTLEDKGSDLDLEDATTSVLRLPPEEARWGQYGVNRSWRNANLSPDFPFDAHLLQLLWQRRHRQHIDGVIAIDPAAAGYLVSATGPLTLADGTVLAGADLATYVEQTLFARYPDAGDQGARKTVLVQLETALFDHLVGGSDPLAQVTAALKAAGEGRLLMWSAHPQEQAVLAQTSLSGQLLPGSAGGPYAGAVLSNGYGNKLDAYLQRDVHWTAGPCTPAARRTSELSVTLTNTAPAGLPAYVAGVDGSFLAGVPYATDRSLLSIYGTAGATPTSVVLDGRPTPYALEQEQGHPVVALQVDTAPGAPSTLTVTWDEPQGGTPAPLLLQPLPIDATSEVSVPVCG